MANPDDVPLARGIYERLLRVVRTFAERALDRQRELAGSDSLLMALWRRGKPSELLHHSDQGSHTSEDFQGDYARSRAAS